MSSRAKRRQTLRDEVFGRSGGECEWIHCGWPATQLAHLHSIGMGGRASADTPDNAIAACLPHALLTDGQWQAGEYEWARLEVQELLGDDGVFLDGTLAWHVAEALKVHIMQLYGYTDASSTPGNDQEKG